VICAGSKLKPDQMTAFVLPMNPMAGTVESLKAKGAAIIPGHDGLVVWRGAGLRRTPDYLIYSLTPSIADSVNPQVVQNAVKGTDALVDVSLDLKLSRATMPLQYRQMMAGLRSDSDWSFLWGPAIKALDAVDHVELGLSNGDQGVRFTFTGAPLKLPPVAQANRPGMPPNVMARLDLGITPGDALPWTRDIFDNMYKSAMTGGPGAKSLTNKQKDLIDTFFTKLSTLVLQPAASTFGVEIIAGEPVLCIVQHWSKPIDAVGEMTKLSDTFNELSEQAKSASSIGSQTYPSDGTTVLRLVAMAGTKPIGALDVAQIGSEVYFTIAPNQYRHIHHLMLASDEGPIKNAISASVDLGKLAMSIPKMKDSPLGDMKPQTAAQLVDLLKFQSLTAVNSADGESIIVTITASKELLQRTPKVLSLFGIVNTKPEAPVKGEQTTSSVRQLLMGCFGYHGDKGAWPDNLDAIASKVGGKEALSKLLAGTSAGTFTYRKPAEGGSDSEKTIVIYEAYSPDASPAKIIVGYADGHVAEIEPAELKKQLEVAGAK
jgi:sulfopyruvate decarboxylase TPP-binding subunit